MNRGVGYFVASLFFFSLSTFAQNGNGTDSQLKRTDPPKGRAVEANPTVSLEELDKMFPDYSQIVSRRQQEKGYTVYGLSEKAFEIQSALHSEFTPVVAIYGDVGSGRTSLLDAYVMQNNLMQNKDSVRILDISKLFGGVKNNLTEPIFYLRSIIQRVQELNESDSTRKTVLVMKNLEALDFETSGRAATVVLEAIAHRRMPMILLSNKEFFEKTIKEKDVVAQRVKGFAAESPKLQSLISLLRSRRLQLEDTYKEYDVRFVDDDAIVDLAHQLVAYIPPDRMIRTGIDALDQAALQFINEHINKKSQIGKWQEEVQQLDIEIKSLERDRKPTPEKLATIAAKKAELEEKKHQLEASKADANLNGRISKIQNDIQMKREQVDKSPKQSGSRGWSIFNMFSRSQPDADQATSDLKTDIEHLEQRLKELQEQQQKAATDGATPPTEIGKQLIHQVLSKLTRLSVSLFSADLDEAVANLGQTLNEHVFGQGGATKELSESIAAARQGLKLTRGPDARMLFAGPSGVGKSEAARQLALALHADFVEESMTNYTNKVEVTNFLGGGKGYTGYEDKPAFFSKLQAASPNARRAHRRN